jgi:hypothetical protein
LVVDKIHFCEIPVTAVIPKAEAFGLTLKLLTKTSGEVNALEILFTHCKRLDVDLFWFLTSEEEH